MRSEKLGLLFVAAVGATSLLLSPKLRADTPPMKVAVVDMQRAVLETEDGLRAQATLRKFFDRRQMELSARQEELGRKKEDIERQSKVLSAQALERAMADWQKQMTELQQTYVDYNKELQKKQNEVTAPIYARISGLLRKLARKDNYDVILERQAVPYARTDLDVTDSLIVMYNSGEEPNGEAPAPPPSAPAPATSK